MGDGVRGRGSVNSPLVKSGQPVKFTTIFKFYFKIRLREQDMEVSYPIFSICSNL